MKNIAANYENRKTIINPTSWACLYLFYFLRQLALCIHGFHVLGCGGQSVKDLRIPEFWYRIGFWDQSPSVLRNDCVYSYTLCANIIVLVLCWGNVLLFMDCFQSFIIISDVVSVIPLSRLNLFIFLLSFLLKFEKMNYFSLVAWVLLPLSVNLFIVLKVDIFIDYVIKIVV